MSRCGTSIFKELLSLTKDGEWGAGAPAAGLEPMRVIRGTDFAEARLGNLSRVPLRYIPSQTAQRKRLEPWDILIETAGGSKGKPTGRSLLITPALLAAAPIPATCASFARFLRVDPDKAHAAYLYWFLQFLYDTGEMEQHQVQHTGVARFQFTRFAETQSVPLPPLGEQQAIARILGGLDSKIEVNRRANATLEAMAQALFKSWFVDFEPVHAKRAGRKPEGMDSVTAALFPDDFGTSEFGVLPTGWVFGTVRGVTEGLFDGPHATPPEATEGPIFLGIRNFLPTSLDLTDVRHISDEDYPRWTKRVIPRALDIVFTYEATLGFFALVPPSIRCCLGRRTALIRTKTEDRNTHFLFHWFVAEPFQTFLRAHRQPGSTVDRIWLKDFPGYPALSPAPRVVCAFERLVGPLWEQVHKNQAEQRCLTALRDALLPKLLSGELRTSEAERLVGKAV